ncbi:MAG: hypothetical protein B6229_07860 [Spirochaetaceae bacterium 4572_7]|nr:MAG: hypothetical protein B6229_07860 [Spirochaetaceae bacterium 4572_7]
MKLLIVDDEVNIRESLKMILEQEGYDIDCAENGLSAQRLLNNNKYNAGIFDLKMPGLNGLKSGALDYIVKPFDPDILIDKINLIREDFDRNTTITESLGNISPLMRKLEIRIARIAKSRSTVLITGESGVGKEVAAKEIHNLSINPNSPFIALNMGGLSDTLAESELFGYEQGAFTGANKLKKGMLELAGEGTLFLDEIGEMPLSLQVKLLRVLQEKAFRRVGGISDIKINSRLITATNKNLEEMVKEGTFREDLFYRLNVARITLPPLRDRLEDLQMLVNKLIDKLNIKMGLSIKTLSSRAWELLKGYTYPGNIRELENILERAMIFVDGTEIDVADLELPENIIGIVNDKVFKSNKTVKTLKESEKDLIIHALHRWEGNRSRAAEELGISRRTIINKINEYNLEE